jgi:hypothetical protein
MKKDIQEKKNEEKGSRSPDKKKRKGLNYCEKNNNSSKDF